MRAFLLATLLLGCLGGVIGQQDSPLKGQNIPHSSTKDIFVSVYLDRLLEVDCFNYRHESILYFYITWNDTSAAEKVTNNTLAVLRGEKTCDKPCTNKANGRGAGCCDGIYLPSFFFRNAYGFLQDREVGWEIYAIPPPNNSVLWVSYIHGTYYQPMDFRKFPFDEIELLIEMDLLDTTPDSRPRMNVHFSSGGTKMYSVGSGDDASEWSVTEIRFTADNQVDKAAWFDEFSTVPSDPRDPLPLKPTVPGTFNPFLGNYDQVFAIYIRIQRFWSYHLIYSVLPITLCAWLGFIVFFLDKSELAQRLQVIVTLFLSLTAIQFVVATRQPYSSYIIPSQQLVLATYVLFGLIAIESIVVFHITIWKRKRERQKHRQEARQRHLTRVARLPRNLSGAGSDAGKSGALPRNLSGAGSEAKSVGSAASLPASPVPSATTVRFEAVAPQDSMPTPFREAALAGAAMSAPPPAGPESEAAAVEAGEGRGVTQVAGANLGQGEWSMPTAKRKPMARWMTPWRGAGCNNRAGSDTGGGAARTAGLSRPSALQRLTTGWSGSMDEDERYAEYLAHVIDMTSLAVTFLAYNLTAVLIFILQHGYVSI